MGLAPKIGLDPPNGAIAVEGPQLTTIHLPHRFTGEMAAKALYDAVINDEPVKSLEVPFSIHDRGTLRKSD
jgi:DNA-binding LacI/PurR family transcriptional regulator